MLVPYYDIWRIIRIAVSGTGYDTISVVARQAVGIMIGAMLIYIAALMCTHISAFRVQTAMRTARMRHIVKLPLGVFDDEGTGKIRRIVSESTAATETYIAHRMRTIANADRIVVLKDGVVAEQGTPAELMRTDSIYKHMTMLQRKSAEWKMV